MGQGSHTIYTSIKSYIAFTIDPSMVFFNFWCGVLSENPSTPVIKKCVKISECVKFEGDILETGEDVDPQS